MKNTKYYDLKELWQGSFQTEIQTHMWNGKAYAYSQKHIPTLEDSPILRQVLQKDGQNLPRGTMLDVGCGTGLFSIALAPYFQQVVGVDIAENMLNFAREKALEYSVAGNCEFLCCNWAELDLNKAGFMHAFDLVFAHMTPAVFNYETFDKLVQASRKRCIFVANARRKNKILDECLKLVGITELEKERDRQISFVFQYLWENGCSPQVNFREENWNSVYTERDMVAWCLDRARLYCTISFEQEKNIANFIHALAKINNGKIMEEVSATVATFDWLVS